jgi:peptide deformylase
MKLKIISQPNPMLSEKSKKISRIDDGIKNLAQDMADTLRAMETSMNPG